MDTHSIVNPFFFQYPGDFTLPKIGTSGFSYRDWIGTVYPRGTKSSDFLEHYQRLFTFCEINSTYYHMPSPSMIQGLAARAGTLDLTIKLPGSLTHPHPDTPRTPQDTENLLDEFFTSLQAGMNPGPIRGILLQFPYRFGYTKENRWYLGELTEGVVSRIRDRDICLEVFVEFRKSDWNKQQVYRGLESRGCRWVLCDLPSLPGLPSMEDQLRAGGSIPPGYLRLHGRRQDTWWQGTAVSRYNYLYSTDELTSITGVLRPLLSEKSIQYIAFNNHHKGKAAVNAIQLSELLLPFIEEKNQG